MNPILRQNTHDEALALAKYRKGNFLILAALSAVMVFSEKSLEAQVTNVYWNPSSLGGTGTWNTSNLNWSGNSGGGGTLFASPNNTTTIFNFSGTAGTVTESSAFTAAGINWLTSGYVWNSTGSRTLTGADSTASGTNAIYIANNANLTITATTGNGFVFDALAMSGGAGSTVTFSNSSGAIMTNIFGTTGAKGGRINSVNTVISGAGAVVLGTGSSSGFTQAGNVAINNSGSFMLTNSASGTLTVSGVVSGSGGLTLAQSSTGKIYLGAANTYSGGTILSNTAGSTITIGNSGAFGSGTITSAGNGLTNYVRSEVADLDITNNWIINSGSVLRLNANNSGWSITASGGISGAGSMYFSNSGVNYKLTGTNNSFGGGVTVGNGTLWFTALGMAGSNSSLGTNGVLQTGASTTAAGFRWINSASETSDKSINLNSTTGGLTITADSATAGASLIFNGAINSTAAGNKTITLRGNNNNSLTIGGLINEFSGSVNSLVLDSTNQGTVVLGNSANSFSGTVSLSGGATSTNTVQVATIGNSGQNSSLGKNGTINIGGSSATGINILKYTGNGETSDKVINLAGTTGGATLDQSGAGNLKFTTAMTATGVGAKSLTLQGSTAGTGEVASAISDLGGNVISLNKAGTGTWTLSGDNSYSGTTTISAGTLKMNGINTGTGAVILNGSSSVLQLGKTNALVNGVLAGTSSSGSTGTVNLLAGGNYSIASYGNTANAGGFMNFTNSSGADATLTFTAATNYVTVSSGNSGGRTVANNSTNLSMIFNGAVDIGSSTSADVQFSGAGNITIKGPVFNTNTAVRSLTKNGAGTLTLEGNNTYNGATTVSGGGVLVFLGSNSFNGLNISSGSVRIGQVASLGSGVISNTSSSGLISIDSSAGTGKDWTLANAVSAGATTNDFMAFSPGAGNTLRLGGAVSGSGWLKVSGGGDLYVNNTGNSYTGGTEVGTGRILVADIRALGTGTINFGTVTNSYLVTTSAMEIANAITIGSGSSSGYTANLDTGENNVTISSIIADKAGNANGGKLNKLGSGTLTLAGANTYSGGTTISAGRLFGSTTSLRGNIINNGAMTLSQSFDGTYADAMSGTGSLAKAGSGAVTLAGTNTYSGATAVNQGTLRVSGSIANSQTTVDSGASFAVDNGGTAGGITSSGTTTVNSGGTAGAVVVNAGTTTVNGTAGNTTVSTGGTLRGSGTVSALSVASGGTLAVGNSPGTLTSSSATWNGGGIYSWEFASIAGTSESFLAGQGSNWDFLNVSGNLDITATSGSPFIIDIVSLLAPGDTSFDQNASYSFAIATAAGGISGFDASDFSITGYLASSNKWSLGVVNNTGSSQSLVLAYTSATAIPEPTTGSLLLIGLMGALAARRKQRIL